MGEKIYTKKKTAINVVLVSFFFSRKIPEGNELTSKSLLFLVLYVNFRASKHYVKVEQSLLLLLLSGIVNEK